MYMHLHNHVSMCYMSFRNSLLTISAILAVTPPMWLQRSRGNHFWSRYKGTWCLISLLHPYHGRHHGNVFAAGGWTNLGIPIQFDVVCYCLRYIQKIGNDDGCYWNMFVLEVGTLARPPVGCSHCSLPASGTYVYSDVSLWRAISFA